MIRNNFDTNSKGISIEFNGSYNTDISNIAFNERFTNIGNFWLYNPYNQLNYDDIKFNVFGKKDDLIKYLLNYGSFTKSELKRKKLAELKEIFMEDFDINLNSFNLENEDLKEYNIEFKPNIEITKIITRGYSQGDYAEVLYSPKLLNELYEREININDVSKDIDNYFWDSPVYAIVKINGNEYDYNDFCDDSYVWDKEMFIKNICETEGENVRNELNNLLPNELDYN